MADKDFFIMLLRIIGKLLPGDYLKTFFYLNLIAKPRKILRNGLSAFYRMDHIYEVLNYCKKNYKGKFSILEFGTENGYAFVKMLYATKYLNMSDKVVVHTFDSFEGLPEPERATDMFISKKAQPAQGHMKAEYKQLEEYCSKHYKNYEIHKGWFEVTITDEFLNSLSTYLPILVWIDCNYYSSARVAFERLIAYLPNSCVIYFDDYHQDGGSRFTGEAKLVYDVNHENFGGNIELVLDQNLSLNTQNVYRFYNSQSDVRYERKIERIQRFENGQLRGNDSPIP